MPVKCVMCLLESWKAAVARKEMTLELYVSSKEKAEFEIMQSPHRRRLVCSSECYKAMLDIIADCKAETRVKKCQRAGCKHSEIMHVDMVYGNPCQASRCKCSGFVETPEEQVSMGNNPILQAMIEAARKS